MSLNRLGCGRAYVKATGLPMHVPVSIVLVLGFSLVLILGLLSVLQALLDRIICQPPLISDEYQQLPISLPNRNYLVPVRPKNGRRST